MADIKSESVADFIPESVADFARDTQLNLGETALYNQSGAGFHRRHLLSGVGQERETLILHLTNHMRVGAFYLQYSK